MSKVTEKKVKVNGTDAKDIALHFVELTTDRATPMIMKKAVPQAKSLLASGYTKEEVISVITFLVEVKHVRMYSLGYVNACINDALKELEEWRIKQEGKRLRQSLPDVEVKSHDTSERNHAKLGRFGNESGFGAKYSLNLSEGE